MIKLLGIIIMCSGMIAFYFTLDLGTRQKKLSEMNMFVDSYSGLFIFMKLLAIILIILGNILIYLF